MIHVVAAYSTIETESLQVSAVADEQSDALRHAHML